MAVNIGTEAHGAYQCFSGTIIALAARFLGTDRTDTSQPESQKSSACVAAMSGHSSTIGVECAFPQVERAPA